MTPRDTLREWAREHRLNLDDVLTEWTERAAIREYDGGFDRETAEKLALQDVIERYGR